MDRRRMLRITAVAGIGSAAGVPIVGRLLEDAALRRVSTTRVRMGTLVTLVAVHRDAAEARRLIDHGFDTMERLETLLSRYRPESAVGRLNASGSLPQAPAELLEVLSVARDLARRSDGAFDPTVLPLLETYQRSFDATDGPPDRASIQAALTLVDHRRLHVDGTAVRLEQPGMALTLDGIAKGYVVDRTVAALVERGAGRVLVDAGGDVATGGSEAGPDPWRVAVEEGRASGQATDVTEPIDVTEPTEVTELADVVELAGGAVATSGDAVHAFSADRRHHHILDPRTGASPATTRSVSVTAPSAMLADALSTTLMVLGPEDGLLLLGAIAGAEGMIVTKDGTRLRSGGFGRPLT